MSNSSGLSTCRRSARSKNVFESHESFCSGFYDSKNIASSSGQSRFPADSGILSNNSPDKVKRKKRRKSASNLNFSKRNRIIKKRAVELNRLRKSYDELIRVKLKDNRIPIVLLKRLNDDHHCQPKLVEKNREKKVEERIQLPGLTIPAKVDPKISKYDAVVKINKRQTENLIEVSKRRLQRQFNINNSDDRREGKSADSMVENNFSKCVERLTDKLESYSSNDNKCNKNQLVSTSSRSHARVSVDKTNNNRLPERLRGANSKFSLSSITENSISENHLKSSKTSKTFVHNNRRLKRNSVYQIQDNNYTSLFESKPKFIENTVEVRGQKHFESSNKDIKKYSKNSTKVIQKHSQNVTDINDQKCLEVSVNIDEKLTFLSFNGTVEKQNEVDCQKNSSVSKNIVENNTRCTRNFTIKGNDRHLDDLIKIGCSKICLERHKKRLSEKLDNDIDDGSKNQPETKKIVTRRSSNKNDDLTKVASEINISSLEKSLDECSKRLSKRFDKINECLHNETENNKRVTRKHDDKHKRHSDNLIETHVKFIENFVGEHNKLFEKIDKNIAVYTKEQIDKTKRSTRSMSDKNEKNIEKGQENNMDHTQNVKESSNMISQNIDKNIQKCFKNLNKNVRRVSRNSEKSVDLIEENSENHSKNIEDEVTKVSRKSLLYCAEEKSDFSKNFDKVKTVSDINIQPSVRNKNDNFSKNFIQNVEQFSEKSIEGYSKVFNDKFIKVLKIPIENKLQQRNVINMSNEKIAGTSTTNCFNNIQSSVEKQIKKHSDLDAQNNRVTTNISEKKKKPRRKLVDNSYDNNTPLSTEDSIEKHNERLTEMNKNIRERSKTEIEIIRKRATKLSDKRRDRIDNSMQQKLDEQHPNKKCSEKISEKINMNVKETSKIQTEIFKKIRRKTYLDKNKISTVNIINDDLNSLPSCVEKTKSEILDVSSRNMKVCSKIQNNSKMITRNSSHYKQDKYSKKLEKRNTYSVQEFTEENKANAFKELDKDPKLVYKIPTENVKLIVTNLSSDRNDIHSENLLKNKINSMVNPVEDNKKELCEEPDRNIVDGFNIENENKIITRRLSHQEYEKHSQNVIESHYNLNHNLIQESREDLSKVFDENFEECTISSTEMQIITRNSLLSKAVKYSEDMTNSNAESVKNLTTQEKKDLIKESHKCIRTGFKFQVENTIIARTSSLHKYENHSENSTKIKTNYEGNDFIENEKKFSEKSNKHIKDCSKIQSKDKMANSNSSPYKYENQADNLIKSKSNYVQNAVSKIEEKVPEELQENVIENKTFLENSSSYKHCNNLIKDKSICVQNGIHKDGEKFPEELYINIKACYKSQAEDNKRSLRKQSFDKRTDNFIEKNSDFIRNTVDRNEEKPSEELHKVIKDCSKSQIENNKRVTRKSSPDKHERHTEDLIPSSPTTTKNCIEQCKEKLVEEHQKIYENLITNNTDSSENSVDKDNEILSQRLDNKENSKIQIDINARMPRSTTLGKEIPSKNLVENAIDCAQTLIEENKGSEIFINNVKIFTKNMSHNINIRKNSVDRINDVHVENFLRNNPVSSQYLVDEISEKQILCSDQSYINRPKEFVETRVKINIPEKSITNQVQNIIESSLEKAQNISDLSDEKDTTISQQNKNLSLKNVTDNNKRFIKSFDKVSDGIINDDSQCVENTVVVSSESVDQFKRFDENYKINPEILINSEINDTLSEDKGILNYMNNFIEINDTQISVNAHCEKRPCKGTDMCSEILIQNNIENVQNSDNEICKNLPEQCLKKKDQIISNNVNNESLTSHLGEIKEKCSESTTLDVPFENNKNQSEDFIEEVCFENSIEIDNHSKTFNETRKNSEKSSETINKITENQADNSKGMFNENSITDYTKAQEDLIEDITEIRAEDLDESIRNSSKILTDNTCLTLEKSNEVIVEHLTDYYNTSPIENLVNKNCVNDSLISRDYVKNNAIRSIENNGLSDNSKTNEILTENTFESNLEFEEKSMEQNINHTENIYSKRIIHNLVSKPVNTINRNIVKTVMQHASFNNETCTMFAITDKQDIPVVDEEVFARERRKITLMELKKKCTENIGNKKVMSLESSRRGITKTLPIFPNINISDTAFRRYKNSSEPTFGNVSENEENYPESLSEDIDSNENLVDRLNYLNTLEYLNLSTDSVSHKEDQQQVQKFVHKYLQSSILDHNADFSCKNCDENFDSNRELKRHAKIKHRQRLVIKITKTDANKHVTHMVEPEHKKREQFEQFEQLNNENTVNKFGASTTSDDEKNMEHTGKKQNIQIANGEIKMIVKKESGSRNSHVVKEIKITPKSGDYGKSDGGSSYKMSGYSPALLETGQPVKRRPGRPRKYPIFSRDELIKKQLGAATTLDSVAVKNGKVSLSKSVANKSLFHPVESIVLQSDVLFGKLEKVTGKKNTVANVKWTETEDSSLAKMLGVKRKRRRTLSPEYQRESDVNVGSSRKRRRQAQDASKEEEETVSEPDFCMKYRITKELVVRLTKLDPVLKISNEFNANIKNVGRNNEVDDTIAKAEDRSRRKMKLKHSSVELEDIRHEPIKTVLKLNLENNNNINDIEKCLTVSSSPRRTIQKTRIGGSEAGSSKGCAEVGQASGSMDDGQEFQRAMKQRLDTNTPVTSKSEDAGNNSVIRRDNNKNYLLEAQLVVTPRRQTIDKAEADESQKAKLLMLMSATTPYETVSKTNVTVGELPQPPTMQLQPQQFCILFIPDALYSSESVLNKDITPTATIVNFQPVPDAEMANRSLIYTPTTPTKISIDEHAKSYVCATCTEVLDLIGRLEASLGMTEEDKSAIKCPYCSNHFQSLFYLEYHVMQEHLKCENEKQCRHSRFNSLRIPSHEVASEFEIYITFALKCRSCYDIFSTVLQLNDHVMHKHKTLVRLRPSLGPAAVEAVCSAYPSFARKNGIRNSAPVFQCPSDCVCRIGVRSSDTPLQRQQMLKRCPHVMRRLEKIESAAYEVYTCTLCKSTFLMKDEVVDHLMKMHEVSCKFPCYTCLTSFRSLQMQENHRCSETTLHDLDKILSIAILPTNVGGKDNNKYLEREDSSTDEYGAIKTGVNELLVALPHRNGFKRKNGACAAALDRLLGATRPKSARLTNDGNKKRKRACPKCKKRFVYRKSLHDHIIYEHILKGDGQDGPKKTAIELLKLVNEGKANGQRAQELAKLLTGHTDDDGIPLKDLTMMDEQENWEEVDTIANESINEIDMIKCSRCKTRFKLPATSGNLAGLNRQHHLSSLKSKKFGLCESCENSGPKTRRQQLQIIHPFACKKCDDTFPTSIELKFHKRTMHTKTYANDSFLYNCDICKKTFTLARMLEKHKKIHRESILDGLVKPDEEEDEEDVVANCNSIHNCSKGTEPNHSLDGKVNTSTRRDSSDSSSAGSKEPEEQLLNCSFCEEFCSSKVSLKNHLKREHGRRASICQFCNGLLIDTSEVRHMLDYHIVPSKLNPRHDTEPKAGPGGPWSRDEAGRMRDDVDELVCILGKHRLQSLMIYHDFEGKCNNAIMRCPICPELFATRESCRFHYVWIHDDNCLLCDETFRSGSSACQHKVNAHTSTASYLWCIQRLVTAIVSTLRLDPNQPSHVLYQILVTKLEEQERATAEREFIIARCSSEKGVSEEAASATDRFLEEVVLSEDQLPDSGNIIEVVIGKEDSEDDLLSMLNLSPNYESCEQHRLPNAGVALPEEEDDEEMSVSTTVVPTTPLSTNATTTVMATVAATAMTASPVVESYVTSGVCKYRLENDEEQLVLVVTDDDLVSFKDDIGSLAERISTTCDSLTLEEITKMLRAYFESVNVK